MMIKAESYNIFSKIYYRLIQLHWSYFLEMDTGVNVIYEFSESRFSQISTLFPCEYIIQKKSLSSTINNDLPKSMALFKQDNRTVKPDVEKMSKCVHSKFLAVTFKTQYNYHIIPTINSGT